MAKIMAQFEKEYQHRLFCYWDDKDHHYQDLVKLMYGIYYKDNNEDAALKGLWQSLQKIWNDKFAQKSKLKIFCSQRWILDMNHSERQAKRQDWKNYVTHSVDEFFHRLPEICLLFAWQKEKKNENALAFFRISKWFQEKNTYHTTTLMVLLRKTAPKIEIKHFMEIDCNEEPLHINLNNKAFSRWKLDKAKFREDICNSLQHPFTGFYHDFNQWIRLPSGEYVASCDVQAIGCVAMLLKNCHTQLTLAINSLHERDRDREKKKTNAKIKPAELASDAAITALLWLNCKKAIGQEWCKQDPRIALDILQEPPVKKRKLNPE